MIKLCQLKIIVTIKRRHFNEIKMYAVLSHDKYYTLLCIVLQIIYNIIILLYNNEKNKKGKEQDEVEDEGEEQEISEI